MNKYLDMKDEVRLALENNQPVVALESTIITHGMPYPENIMMAKKVEQIIRNQNAIPATIAIMNGKIKIGLSDEELETIAKTKDAIKVSRADFASTLALKQTGGTTVAATMICAKLANIKFFVTGGIGGVHRGSEQTMDISSDLEELANTEVTVICAGAKAILDLPKTMEYLETKGVTVIGYQTNFLPAFYVRSSHVKLNLRVDSFLEIANIIRTKEELQLKGGILVVNPILEQDALDEKDMNQIIEEALIESKNMHIEGKAVTPFLLSRIKEMTDGKSLTANLALIYHNAKIGAQIAVAYHNIK